MEAVVIRFLVAVIGNVARFRFALAAHYSAHSHRYLAPAGTGGRAPPAILGPGRASASSSLCSVLLSSSHVTAVTTNHSQRVSVISRYYFRFLPVCGGDVLRRWLVRYCLLRGQDRYVWWCRESRRPPVPALCWLPTPPRLPSQ